EESERVEASETRTVSPSYSTTPLYPNHPLTQISPTLTPSQASYYRNTPHMAMHTQPTLSLGFSTRYHLTLPLRKRYWGTYEPILNTETKGDESEAEGTTSESEESEDEGPDSESEDATSEDQ
ncbi:hypothetical protein Tco_1489280, partial [Tanacetum coccineum]